jgi:hypothetical protein
MLRLPISTALKELSSRNAALTAAYREWARRLPPGPASRLAVSMAEQRIDIGKALAEIAADQSIAGIELEFEADAAFTPPWSAPGNRAPAEPREILALMAEAEDIDHELFAAAAGSILQSSGEVASRFAAEAASAAKRASWARDHLDLLDIR